MSVLASRLDRASASYRANRSANLQLLEEIAEQLAQSRTDSGDGRPLSCGEKWIDPGGAVFRNLTRLSRAGIPTLALVFGSSTAGGAEMHARTSGQADQLAADELLGLAPVDLKVPADVREILARVVDGSRFSRRPTSSSWPTGRTRRCCSSRTPPATWSARPTSSGGSSRTGPR
jgi:hypothetical protein